MLYLWDEPGHHLVPCPWDERDIPQVYVGAGYQVAQFVQLVLIHLIAQAEDDQLEVIAPAGVNVPGQLRAVLLHGVHVLDSATGDKCVYAQECIAEILPLLAVGEVL